MTGEKRRGKERAGEGKRGEGGGGKEEKGKKDERRKGGQVLVRVLATYSKKKFVTGSKLMLYERGSDELVNTST